LWAVGPFGFLSAYELRLLLHAKILLILLCGPLGGAHAQDLLKNRMYHFYIRRDRSLVGCNTASSGMLRFLVSFSKDSSCQTVGQYTEEEQPPLARAPKNKAIMYETVTRLRPSWEQKGTSHPETNASIRTTDSHESDGCRLPKTRITTASRTWKKCNTKIPCKEHHST
jgi:hypothetical protein